MSPSDFPEQLRPIEPRQVGPVSPLRPRRSLGDRKVIAGVLAASALGIFGGFLMRPNLDDQPPAKQAAVRKVEIPKEPEGLGIVVTPVPEPVTPLEPKTAPMEGYTPQPVPQPQPRPQPPVRTSQAPAQVDRPVMRPYAEAAPRPARTARPSFNCRYARTTSERMVCVDPNLAAADRRLARAYNEAVSSGVPERVLRRQQDVWLGARESAARFGPREVARVYEARIAELEQMRSY